MKIDDKIRIGKNILDNAIEMNMSKDIILRISQKIDKYTIEYYRINKNELYKKYSI
ncbi:Spo0E family sporulation regulatory protein-aspartic acid phosphatase [Clostridium sp. D2Q-14]|uniref:Spo0E family sporulation regulatory protein-aspartic acid phosphatase n=1 Tax=Anaeromonas gelatinilytica TaxID=2683194 RepID=UPI00193B90EE|nr:Spo0E family sporulation regulatory protein-aspartic acid phosphatase [Anaeromonas gelatinilytica]MBS4535112.1 Spo0E family sporulation regulatory protein-aspartic acid phosphatase [Anaeromonas gelatinilytica]